MLQTWRIIRALLAVLPAWMKSRLFKWAASFSVRRGSQLYPHIYRLPFNLLLKISQNINEARALRFVESLEGVHAPRLVGHAPTGDDKHYTTYTLMTWVDGDCASHIWDTLTPADKTRIVHELRTQVARMRKHTIGDLHGICAASGGIISDPRIPWLREEPEVIESSPQFFKHVWLGLDISWNVDTIRPAIQPLIEREDIPVVFCHGDILPKNIILPGGLEKWRAGSESAVLIDWEYAGWMPLPWEALKATWLITERDEDEWYTLMKEVFVEEEVELETDWLWRSKSRIVIL
ncbi:hypothetical protein VTO73DRAFT_217 [Trametes versicolor]